MSGRIIRLGQVIDAAPRITEGLERGKDRARRRLIRQSLTPGPGLAHHIGPGGSFECEPFIEIELAFAKAERALGRRGRRDLRRFIAP